MHGGWVGGGSPADADGSMALLAVVELKSPLLTETRPPTSVVTSRAKLGSRVTRSGWHLIPSHLSLCNLYWDQGEERWTYGGGQCPFGPNGTKFSVLRWRSDRGANVVMYSTQPPWSGWGEENTAFLAAAVLKHWLLGTTLWP